MTLSETFNAMSADYTASGLPMVVSPEVRWASDEVKANSHDVDSIIDKMKTCHLYVKNNQVRLREHNEKAIELWNQTLN